MGYMVQTNRGCRSEQLIVALIAGVFVVIAAIIAIVPPMLDRTDRLATLSAQETQVAQTRIAQVTQPTEPATATLDIALIVATLDAQATAGQATLDVQSTSAARATEYAVGTQSIVNQTETATLWTATPTANITASIEAYRTQQAQTAIAQNIIDQSATAILWTSTLGLK